MWIELNINMHVHSDAQEGQGLPCGHSAEQKAESRLKSQPQLQIHIVYPFSTLHPWAMGSLALPCRNYRVKIIWIVIHT